MKASNNLITTPIVDKFDNPIDPNSKWYRFRQEFRNFLFREKTRLPMRAQPATESLNYTIVNRNIAIVQHNAAGHKPAPLAIKYHLSKAHIYKILKNARKAQSHD